MKILKFGGSSVANADNINKVIDIVLKHAAAEAPPVVVVSALGGVTDQLIELASLAASRARSYTKLHKKICFQHNEVIKKLIPPSKLVSTHKTVKQKYAELAGLLKGVYYSRELTLRSLDAVMNFGEQLSAYIISQTLNSRGLACDYADARLLIKTDQNFGAAKVNFGLSNRLIKKYFDNKTNCCVMGGFIAASENGITTTLGRGGSDYSASIIGAALNASVIEIWTDVDGVMTADPRKVQAAFPLPEISYEEAGELAHFGAKVIHPKTMRPARLKNIPLLIKNTFNPNASGTLICNQKSQTALPITGISALSGIALLRMQINHEKNISTIIPRLFSALERCGVEILLTTQASSEQSISLAINSGQLNQAKQAVAEAFALELKTRQMPPLTAETNLSIVAAVGRQMKGVPGISGRFFNALGQKGVNILAIAQGSSELNISAVINTRDELTAVRAIHESFFAPANVINLFLIGTGLIGSALLRQIQNIKEISGKKTIRLCGLANSRTMLFKPTGIALKQWANQLAEGPNSDITGFVDKIAREKLPNSVLVDCTASQDIVAAYQKILGEGICLVTPNKKAGSGPNRSYLKIKQLAKKSRAPFCYHTTVGAGLPIIQIIQQLLAGGDEIIKIEAILSGTLSFIFNTFAQGQLSFSDAVRKAQKFGYTEPDPRDDLAGTDFARKLVILARENGWPLEMKDVDLEPLLPPACLLPRRLSDFYAQLEKQNSEFAEKNSRALRQQKRLRYIGILKKGSAKIALQAVDPSHPFSSLSGCDNAIAITSKNYRNAPLVISGPGAGAVVTASGILANIFSIIK